MSHPLLAIDAEPIGLINHAVAALREKRKPIFTGK
jgi:hypothetical protein